MEDYFNEKGFKDQLANEIVSVSGDLAVDFGEIAVESIFNDDLISEVPILKTIASVCKVGFSIRERHFAKKLATFIKDFQAGKINEDKLNQFKHKLETVESYRDKVLDHIIIMIDRYIEDEKAKILANLLRGYIIHSCSLEEFIEMSACLDLIFISDCNVLKEFYTRTKAVESGTKFIKFSKEESNKIHNSVVRLRANGFIVGQNVARFGGGPEDVLDVESRITEFGIMFCKIGLNI